MLPIVLSLAGCGWFGGGEAPVVSQSTDHVTVRAGSSTATAQLLPVAKPRGVVVVAGPFLDASRIQHAGLTVALADSTLDAAALRTLADGLGQGKREVTLVGVGPEAAPALAAAEMKGVTIRRLALIGPAPDVVERPALSLPGTDVMLMLPGPPSDSPLPALVTAMARQKGCTPGERTESAALSRVAYPCSDGRTFLVQRGGNPIDALLAALAPPPAAKK